MVLGDDNAQPTPAELEQNEGAGARGDAGRRRRRIDFAAIRSGALREDRRAHRAGGRSGEVRRHLRDAHAQRRHGDIAAIDEAVPHRPGSEHPGRNLAPEGRGQAAMGQMPQSSRNRQARARRASTSAPTHTPIRVVQLLVCVHSALGARRRRRQAGGALKDPATARAHPQGNETPSSEWDNEWQEIPGPEAILVASVQIPSCCLFRARPSREIAKSGRRTRSTRSSTS